VSAVSKGQRIFRLPAEASITDAPPSRHGAIPRAGCRHYFTAVSLPSYASGTYQRHQPRRRRRAVAFLPRPGHAATQRHGYKRCSRRLLRRKYATHKGVTPYAVSRAYARRPRPRRYEVSPASPPAGKFSLAADPSAVMLKGQRSPERQRCHRRNAVAASGTFAPATEASRYAVAA